MPPRIDDTTLFRSGVIGHSGEAEITVEGNRWQTSDLQRGFDCLVLSCSATAGDAEFYLQLRTPGRGWSQPYLMGSVRSGFFRSANGHHGQATVDIDTLVVGSETKPKPDAFRAIVEGEVIVKQIAVAAYRRHRDMEPLRTVRPVLDLDRVLVVPEICQYEADAGDTSLFPYKEDGKVAGLICSPTAVTMVLQALGVQVSLPEVARAAYDWQAEIYGNWPANTLAASQFLGGAAFVARLRSFDQLANEIKASRPVVITHSWQPDELQNAPIASSNGHLIVVIGFLPNGDLIVHDPAGEPGQVRRIYRWQDLVKTWLFNQNGICYLFRPPKRPRRP